MKKTRYNQGILLEKFIMRRLFLLLIPFVLAGCSQSFNDPLLDAPVGQRVTCSAIKPMQSQDMLSQVPLNCPEINISATLSELRDAGWRLESVNLGAEVLVNNNLASEVDIVVRKVY